MTDQDLHDHHEAAWAALPDDVRAEALALVRALPASLLDEVRRRHAADPLRWWVGLHFRAGMAARNYLRTGGWGLFSSGLPGIPDDRLPSGNWDDYYVQALERGAA